jgi:hypothetical protein
MMTGAHDGKTPPTHAALEASRFDRSTQARNSNAFDHPMFMGIRQDLDAFVDANLDAWNRRLASPSGEHLRFVSQTPELLDDGLHYEQRIFERGEIATRDGVHDRFNALIWLHHTDLKRAMNARQAADIARVGPRQRTRGQCALTHFDEAGAIVWIACRELLAAWDAHDWKRVFDAHRSDWGERIAVTVIGHALYEYALMHDAMPVAKALAVAVGPEDIRRRCTVASTIPCWPAAEETLAAAIAAGRLLTDPQELRPLPLAGIPGWDAAAGSHDFFETAPCFRPLRAGRRYPSPTVFGDRLQTEAESAHG